MSDVMLIEVNGRKRVEPEDDRFTFCYLTNIKEVNDDGMRGQHLLQERVKSSLIIIHS